MYNSNQTTMRTPEEIQLEIKQTKSSLISKVNNLKSEIKGEYRGTKAELQNKIEDLKSAFDFRNIIKENPFSSLGASLLFGLIVGAYSPAKILGGAKATNDTSNKSFNNQIREPRTSERLAVEKHQTSSFDFKPELKQLKEISLEVLASPIRQLIKNKLPVNQASKVDHLFDAVIEKI